MNKWQEARNYRQIHNENGDVTAYIIRVDDVDVEVSAEVYNAYSNAERRERYVRENIESGRVLSLEKLLEDNISLRALNVDEYQSAEDEVMDMVNMAEERKQKHRLASALTELDEEEKALINALFVERVPIREYAKCLGVHLNAVQYRRNKVLKKLKQKIFEKNL